MERRSASTLLLVIGFVPGAFAQTAPSPAPTPATNTPQTQPADPKKDDASLRDVAGSRQARPASPPDIQPTKPPQPVAPAPRQTPRSTLGPIAGLPPEVGLPGRRFYSEGTFLSRRKGSLFRAPSGDVIFLPQRDANKRGEAPMVIMACQELARLEAVPDAFSKDVVVTMSGAIYVYYDRQYIMPSAYSVERSAATVVATPPASAPTTPTSANSKPSAPAPAAPPADDPDVADLIKDLESKRGTSRAIDPPSDLKTPGEARPVSEPASADPAVTPAGNTAGSPPAANTTPGSAGSVIPEGTTLLNRRARLIRLTGGLLAAAFDGDTTSPAPAPMPFLRCKMTQKLDEAARSRGEDLNLTVSGRITVYDGRNYLLPSLVQVATNGDIRPQQ